jgi:hypothetical protein
MDKSILLQKLAEKKYTHDQLVSWVNSLPGTSKRAKPIEFKVGDVCMHPVFAHPYVLLEKTDTGWICALITSEEKCTEILEVCKSRFFSDNYITKVLFTSADPQGAFIAPFDNNTQLKSVHKKLKKILTAS